MSPVTAVAEFDIPQHAMRLCVCACACAQSQQLFLFSLIQVFVHLGIVLGLSNPGARRWGIPKKEFLIASNAAVGGPTTAGAMAASMGWKALYVPAILVGTLGYASSTLVALAFAPFLRAVTSAGGTFQFLKLCFLS